MPATQRAVAVHYFTGTSLFNRAMRYWCDMPTPRVAELAAKLMPGGTEFHLGNHEFQVRAGEAPELEQRGASVSGMQLEFLLKTQIKVDLINQMLHG